MVSDLQSDQNLPNEKTQLGDLAQANNQSPLQTQQALKYLQMYSNMKGVATEQAMGNELQSQVPGFFSNLWNSTRSLVDHWANNYVGSLAQSSENYAKKGLFGGLVANNRNDIPQALNMGEAAAGGVNDIVKRAVDTSNRIVGTIGEVGTAGHYDYSTGQWTNKWNFGGLKDAGHTVENAILGVGNLANPFSSQNAYQLMSHTMAFYESMAAQYGWSYAMGYAIPSLATGFATDGLLTGAGDISNAEIDSNIVMKFTEDQAAGRTISPEEEEAYQQAIDRINKRLDEEEALKAERAARYQNMSRAMRGTSKFTEAATAPLASIGKLARSLGKPMSDIKLNTMYLVNQQAVQSDKHLSEIWNNKYVRDGIALDAAGRPTATSGQMLAQYFGIDRGSMFFSPVSGLSDFYTKWLGADPMGAYGHAIGVARSFDGFSGKLGEWYGGLGVKNADDVYRAWDQYHRVRSAFEFMADHNASAIADAFRNTYVDDAARGIKASEILERLGQARTTAEVARIHAEIADGISIVRNQMPTMSAYEVMRASIKDSLGNRFADVGDLLQADGNFLRKAGKVATDEGTFDVHPDSELYFVTASEKERGRTVFARWLSTRFVRSTMYMDSLTGRVENRLVHPGSVDAIPAIMDSLRAGLMPEAAVKAAGDALLHAKTPEEYINAYRNAYYHLVARRVTAGMDYSELVAFQATGSDKVWSEVSKLTGLDGGGEKGLYVAGQNGQDLSIVYDEEGKPLGYAGFSQRHLGVLRFPRMAELRGLAKEIRGVSLLQAETEITALHRFDNADTWATSLDKAAEFANVKLDSSLVEEVQNKADEYGDSVDYHNESTKTYNKTSEEIDNRLRSIRNNDKLSETQKFVTGFKYVKESEMSSKRIVNFLDQASNVVNSSMAEEEKARILEQILQATPGVTADQIPTALRAAQVNVHAYRDASLAFERRLVDQSRSLQDLDQWSSDFTDAVREREAARKALRVGSRTKDETGYGEFEKSVFKKKVEEWQSIKNPWTPKFQRGVDAVNRWLNRTFVPMALTSGGWALRVGASEAMLNAARVGGWNYFDAKVTASIAKHEVYGAKLIEAEGKSERSLIRDVVAGALLGVEKNLIKGMDQGRRDRMLDDFVGTIMRHEGHLPGGVHGVNETVYNDTTIDKAMQGIGVGISRDGSPVASEGAIDRTHVGKNINSADYVSSLYKAVKDLGDPMLKPIVDSLYSTLQAEGLKEVVAQEGSKATVDSIVKMALEKRAEAARSFLEERAKNTLVIKAYEKDKNLLNLRKADLEEEIAVRASGRTDTKRLAAIQDHLWQEHVRDMRAEDDFGRADPFDQPEDVKPFTMDESWQAKLELFENHISETLGLSDPADRDEEGIPYATGVEVTRSNMWSEYLRHIDDQWMRHAQSELRSLAEALGSDQELYDLAVQRNKEIEKAIDEASMKAARLELAQIGTRKFRKAEEFEGLRPELEKVALKNIRSQSDDELNRFARNTGRVKQGTKFSRDSAHEEWAAVQVEHVLSVLSGEGAKFRIIHTSLLDQAATGDMKDLKSFTSDINKMSPGAEPKNIPAGDLQGPSLLRKGARADFLKDLSDIGHEKLLGPMVNNLVRDHTFLLEQHNEMERIRHLIDNGILSEADAQVVADARATINMTKFVHNPKDKTLFEQNMRVAAPFYFAQNQAWRRAIRVMHIDPGAFERYLKLSLGVTNYISQASAGGQFPSIYIPGTQFMGTLGMLGGSLTDLGGNTSPMGTLSMGLAADPGSVSSVIPTGAEGGWAGAFGLLRPAWGPLVTLPVKLLDKFMSNNHIPVFHKILTGIIGNEAMNSSIESEFFPSTIGRNVLDATVALANVVGINSISTDAEVSAQNLVMNNAFDNLFASEYKNVIATTNFTGLNKVTGKPWTQNEIITYARAQADNKIANQFNNPQFMQEFLDRAHAAAIVMMISKAVLSFGAPVALSIQDQFSAMPQFQEIQNERNKDKTQKYPTFVDQINEFAQRYPEHIFDLTSRSESISANYPETVSAVGFVENNPAFVSKYPNAAAYLINRNSAYSPAAYTLETSMGLRAKDSPQQYIDALLVAAGNDYYYNWVLTQPAYGGNGDTAATQTTYQQYQNITAFAKAYGRNTNPTWYNSFVSATKDYNEIQALKQMREIVSDPNTPSSIMPSGERSKFESLIKQYDQTVFEVQQLKAAGEGSLASDLENEWYANITTQANTKYWTNQSYFMLSVLRGLPSK
jgi:hypothetical protein